MILPVFIFLSLYPIVSARTVTLSNTRLPLDTSGSPLKTGEASFLFAQGIYWAYLNNWGACKGVDCCPSPSGCASCCFHDGYAPDPCVYTNNHSVVVYSTPDFNDWYFHGEALPPSARRPGIEFRPQVVFNQSHYLMWYEDRWNSSLNPGYALAVALHPAGPFITTNASIVMGGSGRVGDYDVFVDPDSGRGYHVRTGITIQPLDSTMSKPEGAAVDVPHSGVEGPAMFKRFGVYYLLVGAGCCACRGGSNVIVYTAPAPLGPWTLQGDVGSNTTDGHTYDAHSPWNYVTRAQQTKVVAVPDAEGTEQFLWVGNQWVTSTEAGAPRNNDLLFFAVLNFADDGNVTQMQWAESATLHIP